MAPPQNSLDGFYNVMFNGAPVHDPVTLHTALSNIKDLATLLPQTNPGVLDVNSRLPDASAAPYSLEVNDGQVVALNVVRSGMNTKYLLDQIVEVERDLGSSLTGQLQLSRAENRRLNKKLTLTVGVATAVGLLGLGSIGVGAYRLGEARNIEAGLVAQYGQAEMGVGNGENKVGALFGRVALAKQTVDTQLTPQINALEAKTNGLESTVSKVATELSATAIQAGRLQQDAATAAAVTHNFQLAYENFQTVGDAIKVLARGRLTQVLGPAQKLNGAVAHYQAALATGVAGLEKQTAQYATFAQPVLMGGLTDLLKGPSIDFGSMNASQQANANLYQTTLHGLGVAYCLQTPSANPAITCIEGNPHITGTTPQEAANALFLGLKVSDNEATKNLFTTYTTPLLKEANGSYVLQKQ